jgi:hypothetical protein
MTVLEYTPLPGSTDDESVEVYGDHCNIASGATRGNSSSCRSHRVVLYARDGLARFQQPGEEKSRQPSIHIHQCTT